MASSAACYGVVLGLAAALAAGAPGSPLGAGPAQAQTIEDAAAGPVGLPEQTIADAAAFDGFVHAAGAISPNFTGPQSVSRMLNTSRAYSPRALVRGAVAYGAIAALESQDFVAAVREAGADPQDRERLLAYIAADPSYVLSFRGADAAAGLARGAVGPQSVRLYLTGRAVLRAAYDVQRQSWSRLDVADLKGRLAAAEAAAVHPMTAEPERVEIARRSLSGAAPLPLAGEPLAPLAAPYTSLINRALQVAAIAALGEAREGDYDRLAALTDEPETTECLARAKRNFHQCLAVARPNYEDVFCSGRHALLDTAACLAKAEAIDLPGETPRVARVDF
jgi:hypothetical protein